LEIIFTATDRGLSFNHFIVVDRTSIHGSQNFLLWSLDDDDLVFANYVTDSRYIIRYERLAREQFHIKHFAKKMAPSCKKNGAILSIICHKEASTI